MKRVVFISDLHCGHRVGLTPPRYQGRNLDDKWNDIQNELWCEYTRMVKNLSPIYALVVNGDCIDGLSYRSGGSELITTDRLQQIRMAAECIKAWDCSNIKMTYGTPYHTGHCMDLEEEVADKVGATIEGHAWLDVDGLIFDVRHFVSKSSVPYSKTVSIARAKVWNLIWADFGEQPNADILIRSHLHSFDFCGNGRNLCVVTPSLTGMGSKFGSRVCEGHVDFGVVWFDVEEEEEYTWGYDLADVEAQKTRAVAL